MARRRDIVKEVAFPLTPEAVTELSNRYDEPDWLLDRRSEAWALAASIPMPTTDDEPWRRTDIRRVDWDRATQLVAPPEASLDDVPDHLVAPLIGDEHGGLIVHVDGQLVHAEVAAAVTEQGVIFSDLRTAFIEHRDLVEQYFMTECISADDGKFAALHAALWTHGVFLYVPEGVHVELPLHSLELVRGQVTTSTHILAVAEQGSSVTYLHDSKSDDDTDQLLHMGATELLAGDDAHLRYVALQNWGEHTVNFGHQRGRVGKGGQLDWVSGEMGTQFGKLFMTLDLDGDDSWGRISGLYFTHNRQHIDLDTQQNHHALRTTSDLLFKGTLRGNSRTVWQGMIQVDPGAQRTDGFQANRNLLLESSARADSIPGLEIEADDVRCTHAATIGRVDEEQIFYLMARGIPRETAVNMIVEGFFDPVMQRIPFEGVRDRLTEHIYAKLDV